jgi:hypothetical protein
VVKRGCAGQTLKAAKKRFRIACQRCCEKFEAALVESRAGSRLGDTVVGMPEFRFATRYKALHIVRNRTDNAEARLKCVEAEKRGYTP